jgi:hypothetical protein
MHWRQNIWTWRWLLAPLGAALYALRVSLEATPSHLLWGAFAALVVLLVGVLLRRTSFSLAPLNLLWAYVPWPAFWPALALGVGVTSAVALLIANLPDGRRAPWVADGLLLTGALALYVGTLAPTILAADGGEFQIVGPVLGVAHPPGFALYTMLAKLFSLLPFGEVAYRVNLTGAVAGALALVVVSRTARDITGSIWAGLAAACALGVSTTFWAQSTTANIRALTILFIALCCSFLVRYLSLPAGSKQGGRALAGFAFSYGLAIAHHAWPAILAPLLVGVALWHDPPLLRQLRRWPRYLAAFVLPFLSDLYIVVRAITGAPFGTADLIDAGRVVDHLIGRGFSGDMFAYLHLNRTLWERFLVVGNILHLQFGLPLLLLAGVGAAWLVWRRPKMAVLLGGVFLIMALIVATYRAPQSVEYLMPAYVPVAVCVGCAGALVRRLALPRTSRAVLAAFVFLPAFALGARQLPSYRALHQDRTAREYAESVLLAAPPGAQILSNWHWYTPLRYLQLVEGQRADVDVVYIYPQGATAMPQAWPQQIERALSESDRPLVVTSYYPTYLDLPYRFEPLGEAYLVRAEPRLEMPDGFIPLNARLTEGADAIQLLGVRASGTGGVRPGEQVSVDLAWQPVAPLQRGYAFSVQLIGADGVPRGQRDRRHDAAPSYAPGEVLVDRYQFPVFAAAEPGAYHLLASVYYTGEGGTWRRLTLPDGQDTVSLGTIDLLPAEQAPVSVHPQNQAFLAGPSAATATGDGPAFVGPTLVGVDYDDTLPEGRRVYLHWRGAAQPAVAQLTSGAQLVAQATIPALDPYGDPSTPLGTPVDRRGPGRAAAPAQADTPATGRTGYVSIALDVPPGTRDLRLSLVDAQTGRPLARRGPWGLSLRAPLRLPALPAGQHYLPFGGKLALTGFQASSNWKAGKPARVALRFLGLQPIVLDYVVSVRVDGVQAMPGPSDSVPALGAIPTFKWIRGSCVNDVHLLETLPGATGQGQLVVGVYDAFTTEALMPLDERVARLGLAGVPLQPVTIR